MTMKYTFQFKQSKSYTRKASLNDDKVCVLTKKEKPVRATKEDENSCTKSMIIVFII